MTGKAMSNSFVPSASTQGAVDLRQCEHCDKEFPIETMTTMEDCWFCEGCVAEWRKEFAACDHKWSQEPYTGVMGDEGKICERCNGFVTNEDRGGESNG